MEERVIFSAKMVVGTAECPYEKFGHHPYIIYKISQNGSKTYV
jgi:hypothetical protein